jgi:hypothetical protein
MGKLVVSQHAIKTLHKFHNAMAALHNATAGKDGADTEHHGAAADLHQEAADGLHECLKAQESIDLSKADSLVPSAVSVVTPTRPTITPVLRHGMSPISMPAVDPQFAKLVEIEDDSMEAL